MPESERSHDSPQVEELNPYEEIVTDAYVRLVTLSISSMEKTRSGDQDIDEHEKIGNRAYQTAQMLAKVVPKHVELDISLTPSVKNYVAEEIPEIHSALRKDQEKPKQSLVEASEETGTAEIIREKYTYDFQIKRKKYQLEVFSDNIITLNDETLATISGTDRDAEQYMLTQLLNKPGEALSRRHLAQPGIKYDRWRVAHSRIEKALKPLVIRAGTRNTTSFTLLTPVKAASVSESGEPIELHYNQEPKTD